MYQITHGAYPKVVEQLDKLDISKIKNKTVDQLNQWERAKLVYALIEDDFDVLLESMVELSAHECLDFFKRMLAPNRRGAEAEGSYWEFMAQMFTVCNSYLLAIFESYKDAYFEEHPNLRPMSDYEHFINTDRRAA